MPLLSLSTLRLRLLVLFVLLAVLLPTSIGRKLQLPTSDRHYIPGQYIVEYDTGATGSFDDLFKRVVDHLSSDKLPAVDVNRLQQYDSDVLKGIAIQTVPKGAPLGTRDDASIVELSRHEHELVYKALQQAEPIKAVYRDFLVHQARDIIKRRLSFPVDEGQSAARDPAHWQSRSQEIADPFPMRAPENTTDPVVAMEDFGPHVQTGVNIQHARGNFGEGVTVCVLDTGIDYSHPSFNADKPAGTPCLGQGCRVVGGIDFFGADFDGVHRHVGPPRYKDLQKDRECYHGTHVAGIVGAATTQYSPFPFAGAAPKAKFRDYQVFSCSESPFNSSTGGTTTPFHILLSGIDDGYKNGCDIMHASLGAFAWDTFDAALSARYAEKGLLCSFSAGNDGTAGLWSVASPAQGLAAVGVGATTNIQSNTLPLVLDKPLPDGTKALNMWTFISWSTQQEVKPLKVWFSPQGLANPEVPDDLCNPIGGKDAPNLEGYVAFLFRTTEAGCEYAVQAQNLADLNATAFVAINDERPPSYRGAGNGQPLLGMVSHDEGIKLLDAYKKSKDITLTFSPKGTFDYTFSPSKFPENISVFSSNGPDNYGQIKPDVLAVGEEYLSTVPIPDYYGVLRGTSMSGPLMSGSAALYKSAKGMKPTPAEIQRAFVHSARPLSYDAKTPSSPLLSVFMQGGGQINVTAAIDSKLAMEPDVINILDTPRATLKQTITISNENEDVAVTENYTLSHLPAQSLYGLQPGAPVYREDTNETMIPTIVPKAEGQAGLTFDPPTLSLVGQESGKVTVTFTPPPDDPRLLMYSGYIQVTPAKGPDGALRVPYGGIAGSMASVPAIVSGWIDPINTNLPALFDDQLYSQIRDDTTSFPFNDKDNMTAGYPVLALIMNTASERVTCDLVKADVEFTPTLAIIDDETCCQNALGAAGLGTPIGHETVRPKPEVLPDPKRLYNDTAVVGNMIDVPFVPRDVSSADGVDPSVCTVGPGNVVYDPKTGDPIPIPEGEYRFLLRAHKWNSGDLDHEINYSSYLSHAFKYDKASKGIVIPPPQQPATKSGAPSPYSGPGLGFDSLGGSTGRGAAVRDEIRRRQAAGEEIRLRGGRRR